MISLLLKNQMKTVRIFMTQQTYRTIVMTRKLSRSTILVIPLIITWCAHSSGMSQLVTMHTVCSLLISTNFVITILAEAFGVVLSVDVYTVFDFPVFHSHSSRLFFSHDRSLLLSTPFFIKIFANFLAVDLEIKLE